MWKFENLGILSKKMIFKCVDQDMAIFQKMCTPYRGVDFQHQKSLDFWMYLFKVTVFFGKEIIKNWNSEGLKTMLWNPIRMSKSPDFCTLATSFQNMVFHMGQY
jgi:hypothetical protein